jgi:hypothetical protein
MGVLGLFAHVGRTEGAMISIPIMLFFQHFLCLSPLLAYIFQHFLSLFPPFTPPLLTPTPTLLLFAAKIPFSVTFSPNLPPQFGVKSTLILAKMCKNRPAGTTKRLSAFAAQRNVLFKY